MTNMNVVVVIQNDAITRAWEAYKLIVGNDIKSAFLYTQWQVLFMS